jgi:hypothetical protein
MTYRQDIVSSLILAPIRSGLRGFCLFYIRNILKGISAKKSVKILCPAFLFVFVNNVH